MHLAWAEVQTSNRQSTTSPPDADGRMHLEATLKKCPKDFIVKIKTLGVSLGRSA
jgi:hypothetical protein